jgi:cell division cycle 2-like protein
LFLSNILHLEHFNFTSGACIFFNQIFKTMGTPNETVWSGFSQLRDAKKAQWRVYSQGRLREILPSTAYSGGGSYLSDLGFDLLQRMLCYDPERRISAKDVSFSLM